MPHLTLFLCGHGGWKPSFGYVQTPRGVSVVFYTHFAKDLMTSMSDQILEGSYTQTDRVIGEFSMCPNMQVSGQPDDWTTRDEAKLNKAHWGNDAQVLGVPKGERAKLDELFDGLTKRMSQGDTLILHWIACPPRNSTRRAGKLSASMRQITSIKKSPGASALITWTEPLRGFSTSQRATTSPFTASSSASCRSNCRRLPKSIRKSHDGEELMCIECGLDNYPNWGIYKTNTRERVRMFVAVLRWTGMRISDAVQLSRSTIVDGQITLRTQKTGKRVSIPMNPFIAEGLKDIGGEYFFWSGNGKVSSAVSDWERTLARLGKLSHVKCHAHRWRHTFIIECLWRGVPVSEVAAIVGKSPRIIEQHYSQVGAIRAKMR